MAKKFVEGFCLDAWPAGVALGLSYLIHFAAQVSPIILTYDTWQVPSASIPGSMAKKSCYEEIMGMYGEKSG